MSALLISNNTSFGAMTNQSVSRLAALHTTILRLNDAIATASSGYDGTPGTQFETGGTANMGQPNNFGVQASDVPGEQGQAYSYAVSQLYSEWSKFWAAAEPYIAALDNGQPSF